MPHASSPMCVQPRGSRLQEQMRPRAFLAFSPFPPPLPLELHPGCFSAAVLITCLYKHPSWNLPPSLETLPASNLEQTMSPRVLTPSSASSSLKGQQQRCHLGGRKDLMVTGDIQLFQFLLNTSFGVWLGSADDGSCLSLCPACTGLLSAHLSSPNGLLAFGGRSKADNCFPFLINRYKMPAQGAHFQLICCASDARCWLFTIPR